MMELNEVCDLPTAATMAFDDFDEWTMGKSLGETETQRKHLIPRRFNSASTDHESEMKEKSLVFSIVEQSK